MSVPAIGSALVASAHGDGARLLEGLAPAWPAARAVGPAFTVAGIAGDNLALHRAVEAAPAGAVLVAHLAGPTPGGHWGELLALRALARGLAGLVVDHTVRDLAEIELIGFPVFHRGTCPFPAEKREPGELGGAIVVDGAAIHTGDLVVADRDGILVVAARERERALAAAQEHAAFEASAAARVRDGERLCDVLGLALPGEGAP